MDSIKSSPRGRPHKHIDESWYVIDYRRMTEETICLGFDLTEHEYQVANRLLTSLLKQDDVYQLKGKKWERMKRMNSERLANRVKLQPVIEKFEAECRFWGKKETSRGVKIPDQWKWHCLDGWIVMASQYMRDHPEELDEENKPDVNPAIPLIHTKKPATSPAMPPTKCKETKRSAAKSAIAPAQMQEQAKKRRSEEQPKQPAKRRRRCAKVSNSGLLSVNPEGGDEDASMGNSNQLPAPSNPDLESVEESRPIFTPSSLPEPPRSSFLAPPVGLALTSPPPPPPKSQNPSPVQDTEIPIDPQLLSIGNFPPPETDQAPTESALEDARLLLSLRMMAQEAEIAGGRRLPPLPPMPTPYRVLDFPTPERGPKLAPMGRPDVCGEGCEREQCFGSCVKIATLEPKVQL